ncbi:MAG TPA: 5-(carboxyamino)imidazole ribonucleotide mutase [Ignavibacteriaceae bacterium]|nr:5-(carboxyamino)imidazole ribonucleotide mutase [Ignavibacteriaceae bacterium]
MNKTNKVAILMGSDSDLPIMREAYELLKQFGIEYEVKVISAHRSPRYLTEYLSDAIERGIKVVIAGAGGAAHLPGVVASYFPLSVIGVPVKAKSLEGLDSLLSIVQMPLGVPVATVGINQAKNAGILAVQILATHDNEMLEKFIAFKKRLEEDSLKKNDNLNL